MHSKRSRDGTFIVINGKVTAFHPAPEEDEINENETVATNEQLNSFTGNTVAVKLPRSFT